jgi:hypothetical protein
VAGKGNDGFATRALRRLGFNRPEVWVLLWAVWSLTALGVLAFQDGAASICRTR